MLDEENFADFYLGRGPTAQYLGTITESSPGQLDVWTRFTAADPDDDANLFRSSDFAAGVVALMHECADGVPVRKAWTAWPHEHTNSGETPWAYSFDNGAVYVDRFGYLQGVIYSNQARKPSAYPAPQ